MSSTNLFLVSHFLFMFLRTFPTAVKKLPPPDVSPQRRPFRDIGLARRILHHFINGPPVSSSFTPSPDIFPVAKIPPECMIEQIDENAENEYSQHDFKPSEAGSPGPFPRMPPVIVIWLSPTQDAPNVGPIDSRERERIVWHASADGGR